MVHKLFEDFLDKPEAYAKCVSYWKRLIDDIAVSLDQSGDWVRWILPDNPNDELDGNPIYHGRSQTLGRAFRIIQGPATSDNLRIAGWLSSVPDWITEFRKDELVIGLALSLESSELAGILLRKWMAPATTLKEMESTISDVIPEFTLEDEDGAEAPE